MDIGPGTEANLLERALEGEPVTDEQVLALVAMAQAARGLDQSGLAPRPDFVTSLRARLLDETTEIAVGADGPRAVVLRLPRRSIQLVAAAAATFILLAGLLGFVSRSAVPGDALYPVKQLLDRAAVALAGSPLDEGRTHLAQAQQHISEARDLLDRGDVVPADLSTAFDAASDAVVAADTILRDVYATEGRPEALTELADVLTRARLQVEAMDTKVPDASRPAYERLRQLLADAEIRALREVAACTGCGAARAEAARALATILTPSAAQTATSPATASGLSGATVVGPSVGITTDGLGADGGGATLPGATLDLPGVEVTTSEIVIGSGGVTLPGATVPLPSVTLSAPALPGATPPLSTTLLP